MTDYANLAQYNNGIAFKPLNNRKNVISSIKNNIIGRQSTSGYYTLNNAYISFPTNCTNVMIPTKHSGGFTNSREGFSKK